MLLYQLDKVAASKVILDATASDAVHLEELRCGYASYPKFRKDKTVNTPCIDIKRHGSHMYAWALLFDGEVVVGASGYASVADSLSGAMEVLAKTESHVELRYGGVHLGTYPQPELRKTGSHVAGSIAARDVALTRTWLTPCARSPHSGLSAPQKVQSRPCPNDARRELR